MDLAKQICGCVSFFFLGLSKEHVQEISAAWVELLRLGEPEDEMLLGDLRQQLLEEHQLQQRRVEEEQGRWSGGDSSELGWDGNDGNDGNDGMKDEKDTERH